MYRARHLAAFVIAAVLATAAFLGGLLYGLEPRLADPRAVHEFFFNRSPIQWCTLAVFFFALSVLGQRTVGHRRLRRDLRALEAGRPPRRGPVAERLRELSACKQAKGPEAAAGVAGELANRNDETLGRTYGVLQQAVQLMLALGFLGTVWGISRSLFGSFALLSGTETEQLRAGLEGFTVALSTALDTSVLGLVCGLVATVIIAIAQWAETDASQLIDRLVSRALALDGVAPEGRLSLDRLQAELTQLGHTLARDARATVATIVTRSAALYETKLLEATEQHLARLDEHQRRLFEGLSESLARHLALALRTLEEHGEQLRGALVSELRDIARGLQRVPEVSIRYPNLNGHGATQPADS